jgi:hypothetical protein
LTTRGHHRSRSKRKKKGTKKARENLTRQYEVDEEETVESEESGELDT